MALDMAAPSESGLTDDGDLPIKVLERASNCNLCGHDWNEKSPLTNPVSIAQSNGLWPWPCRKAIDENNGGAPCREPKGKYCKICINTAGCMGLLSKFGTIHNYYKHLCKPENMQESRRFALGHQEWIRAHNADGHFSPRLKGTKEFLDRVTVLSTETAEFSGFKDGGEWDFVEREHWDTKLDGEFDQARVVKTRVFGQEKEGVWVRRGRLGVYKWQHEERSGARLTTKEDDGTGPFAEERLQNKLGVVRGGLSKFEKERVVQMKAEEQQQKVSVAELTTAVLMFTSCISIAPTRVSRFTRFISKILLTS